MDEALTWNNTTVINESFIQVIWAAVILLPDMTDASLVT